MNDDGYHVRALTTSLCQETVVLALESKALELVTLTIHEQSDCCFLIVIYMRKCITLSAFPHPTQAIGILCGRPTSCQRAPKRTAATNTSFKAWKINGKNINRYLNQPISVN